MQLRVEGAGETYGSLILGGVILEGVSSSHRYVLRSHRGITLGGGIFLLSGRSACKSIRVGVCGGQERESHFSSIRERLLW